jgi:hypothetical protein
MTFTRKNMLRSHTNVTDKTTRLEERRDNNNWGVKAAISYESSALPGDETIPETAQRIVEPDLYSSKRRSDLMSTR